ncbi:hypothetical protein [Candidatus Venteria ishoeyi]|uniref:Uncharacterized protein n=1 Tax=Candidatus Venteria ishoeyi TaxID=1899563 RepID=A0A1H6F5A4_9GAMM|nr:hypothetical protein [Candidatus Venteria ishoeyi]SEH05272.1 Uncharacterised protein [Candidatus Venteria ishoeyi]
MKQFFVGSILFIISVIAFIPLAVWGIIELIVKLFYKKKFWKALGKFGDVILLFATIIDVTLNVICQVPLNRFFQENGYKFGNRKDTISRALGINERDGTLTKSGDFLCRFLNMIQKDHCKISI